MKIISLILITVFLAVPLCLGDTIPPDRIGDLSVGTGTGTGIGLGVGVVEAAPLGEAVETLSIEIGTVTISDGKIGDTIDVVLDAGSFTVAGFDFVIGTECTHIEILDIIPGETPDSCGWEFFKARKVESQAANDQPASLWKVTGLAKTSPTKEMPPCFSLERKSSLVRIIVGPTSADLPPDGDVRLFFFWESCRDNILSDQTGQITLVSRSVRDGFEQGPVDLVISATRAGVRDGCIDESRPNHPIRRIDFRNGGIRFELKVEKK